ncbi:MULTISPECIES: diguanylate cyclase domain-containing protein [unclassified Rhizobium]|uniref:diguanylate cyclase domain-containing protein n=1 Tax=unclassified Rhizobium TaxID=2613769 RepID=UPI0035A94576
MHGHAVGDELLQVVAERLLLGTPGLDRVFGIGGDEFAIFMPGCFHRWFSKATPSLSCTAGGSR